MTHPDGPPDLGDGTDISAADPEVDPDSSIDTPASSDPDEMTGDGSLGGTGGQDAGGAG